jgi:hypothetical protein
MDINNNPQLFGANFTLSNISSALILATNGQSAVWSFPNLIWAANITARDCSQFNIPSLSVVNGSLGLYGSSFSSLSAPKLISVGNLGSAAGSLAIVSNAALTDISMPGLKSVGGTLQIAQDTILTNIAFPALVNVGGAIDFTGNFTT